MTDPSQAKASHPTRPTIGLIIGNSWDSMAWDIWEGVNDVAREHDANLICFAGDDLETPFEHYAQANRIYDLVRPENVDCVVIWGGGLCQYVTPKKIQELCEKFHPLPTVSLAIPLPQVPTVLADNYQGMREVILHLIQAHQFKRIGFVTGPKDHPEAQERFRAYEDVLAEQGLAFDPDLVAPGDFNPDSGAGAVRLFMDQRKLRPGIDFEAIVTSGDVEALTAITVLRERGFRVPEDVAITGFDNVEAGWFSLPPITTVPMLLHQQAHKAAEMALALVNGQQVPMQTMIPTRLVVRQSCGCQNPLVRRAAADCETIEFSTPGMSLELARPEMLAAIQQELEKSGSGIPVQQTAVLLNAFLTELHEEQSNGFLTALQNLVLEQASPVSTMASWHGFISELRRHVRPFLHNEKLDLAEDIWQQARVIVSEVGQQVQVQYRLQADRRAQTLHEISQSLITAFDMNELVSTIQDGLAYLGIPSVFVSLYEDPQKPAGKARLIVGYNQDGQLELAPQGRRFDAPRLVPWGLLPQDRRYCWVVEPLFFQTDQLGFAVFEAEPREAIVYDALRGFISSALKGAMVLQQHQQMQKDLRQERDFADSLLETAPVIVLLLDRDGRILRFNSYMEEVSGYLQDDVLGKDWFAQFIPRRERRVTKAIFSQAIDGSKPYSHITSILTKDGRRRQIEWFHKRLQDTNGDLIGLLSIGQDVSERRQAEQRLAAIHSFGQDLVLSQNTSQIASLVVEIAQRVLGVPVCGFWLVDESDNTIACQALAAAPGINKAPIIPINSVQSIIAHVVRSGEVVYLPDVRQDPRYLSSGYESRSELCIPFKVANKVLGVLNAESGLVDAFGPADRQLMEALANAAAIAVRNARLYEEARSRAERLAVANRNAWAANKELEAFAYSVSHDLRAPLRSINGFSQALLDDYGDRLDEEGQDYLFRLQAASLRMGDLIDGLLQLSRLTRGKLHREELNLSSMLQEIVADLQKGQPDRQLEIRIAPNLRAHADPRLVRVALGNLLNNAWKFTQKTEKPRIEVASTTIDDQITYYVRDNGAGFEMAYADKLFGAFQRLHTVREFEGTGIGLATVQRIIQRHGGTVWGEGKTEEGATFYFTLPPEGSPDKIDED